MQRDCGDLIDRWSIAKLKSERIGSEDSINEFNAFNKELSTLKSKNHIAWQLFTDEMLIINSTIWMLESSMKSGKEILPNSTFLDDEKNIEVLAGIGKNAILIRNVNSFRVGLKNIINIIVGEGFIDAKQDHMSS